MEKELISEAAEALLKSKFTVAFTGAGISAESGIPPFRGVNGLWNKYDPDSLEITHFFSNPFDSWKVIREIFYDFFGKVTPNPAHYALSKMEACGMLNCLITQNIDNLHQQAGSREIYEFHGNSHKLVCTDCNLKFTIEQIDLKQLPPLCPSCSGLLKPDFVFFGEGIPREAYNLSMEAALLSETFLIIGTTGEVAPANSLPQLAKSNGALIIEVNIERSRYTDNVTDIFLKGKASTVMDALLDRLGI